MAINCFDSNSDKNSGIGEVSPGIHPTKQATDKFHIIPLFAVAGKPIMVGGGGPFPGGAPGLQNR
jgi:hypothetical protein